MSAAESVEVGAAELAALPIGGAGFPYRSAAVLDAIVAHRLMTSFQLQALVMPDKSRQNLSKCLVALWRGGYVDFVRLEFLRHGRAAPKGWFATPRGFRAAKEGDGLVDMGLGSGPTVEQMAPLLREHTVGVNEVGALVAHQTRLRGRGEAVSWQNEVLHEYQDADGRNCSLRSDLVLRLDVDVAGRPQPISILCEYARYSKSYGELLDQHGAIVDYYGARNSKSGRKAWAGTYRGKFPSVMWVFGGKGADRRMTNFSQMVVDESAAGEVATAGAKLWLRCTTEDRIRGLGVYDPECFFEPYRVESPWRNIHGHDAAFLAEKRPSPPGLR